MKINTKSGVLYSIVIIIIMGFIGLAFAESKKSKNSDKPKLDLRNISISNTIAPPLSTVSTIKPSDFTILRPKKRQREYQTHGVVFFDLAKKNKTYVPETSSTNPDLISDITKNKDLFEAKALTNKVDAISPQISELARFSKELQQDQHRWLRTLTGQEKLPQPKGVNKSLQHIAVPDIKVEIRKSDYITTIASATTDLHGHYRIPEVPEGNYALCWKGAGWAEECFAKLITIQKQTFYSDIIYIKPAAVTDTIKPLTGKVKMLDGQLCRHLDIKNSVNLTASVQLNHNKVPVAMIRANSMGQYVFPVAPRNSQVSVAAHCPDVSPKKIEIALKSQEKVRALGRLLVTGDMSLFAILKAASGAVNLQQQARQDLVLLGKKPKIIGFGAKDASGHYITKMPAGEVVQLSSAVLDSQATKKYVRFWRVSGGELQKTGDDSLVEWRLPKKNGQYTAEVSIADGRGGWAAKKLIFQVTEDTRLSFSGVVRNSAGATGGAIKAVVQINGQTVAINQGGYFRGLVKPADDNRYTLSVKADGYMPLSFVYHRATSGGTYVLEPVETRVFNATQPATVSFAIPNVKQRLRECYEQQQQTDQRCDLKARAMVELDPGSLVDQSGQTYKGTVTAQGAFLNPSLFSMPGDYDGLSLGAESQSLISYGAMYVSFKDSSGNKLQLGNNQTAKITIPVPSDRNLAKAPPTIPLWYYNYDTGFWEEEGVGYLSGNVYQAQVKHFSTINMDVGTVGNAVCARVEVDFLNTPEDRILKVTTTLPGGGTQVKQATMDDALNAVYRLIPNETVTFDIRRSDGSDYPEAVYKDEGGLVIPDGQISLGASDLMAGVDLWPESPFDDCVPYVLLTGDIEPGFVFLSRKNANNTTEVDTDGDGIDDTPQGQLLTEAYYELMDADDDRLTLEDWLEHNGFDPSVSGGGFDFPASAQVVELSYLNHGDLGSGRRMHCRKDSDRVACVVGNYAADDDIDNAFNRDPAAAEIAFNANMGEGFATVAMEYSNTEGVGSLSNYGYADSKLVKFFTYGGDGNRIKAAGLDRVSDPAERWHPNACMVCHGGTFPSTYTVKNAGGSAITVTDPNTGASTTSPTVPLGVAALNGAGAGHREALLAKFMDSPSSFREFDLEALRNLQGTFPEAKAKQLNCNYVQETLPPGSEIQTVLDSWYGANCTEAGSPVQNSYIPATWSGNNTIYTQVAGKTCRTCHIAQAGLEVIAEGSYPWSTMTSSGTTYPCSASMPQAAVTHNAYWMENMDEQVVNAYGGTPCP